jgi:hypothetical protein
MLILRRILGGAKPKQMLICPPFVADPLGEWPKSHRHGTDEVE